MTQGGDVGTRRLIAGILGALGAMILIDVLIIALAEPDRPLDGFRQAILLVVGALLVLGGAISFAWPKRGQVTTEGDDDDRTTREQP
jgi:hypothetical protein